MRLRPGVPSRDSWVGSQGTQTTGCHTRVCSAEIWMARWVPQCPQQLTPFSLAGPAVLGGPFGGSCVPREPWWVTLSPEACCARCWVQPSSANPPENLQKQ